MRYKVGDLVIRSENAALSMKQPSQELLGWIRAQDRADHVLDYGCGKLRYAVHLSQKCNHLTLVDSRVQLTRIQALGDSRTTIVHYAKTQLAHARCLTPDEFALDHQTYDFVLCANVLSAIPDESVRSQTLRRIAHRLDADGIALFVTQYRNSYFALARTRPNARRHLDGWILEGKHGCSYYGTLPKNKLEHLLRSHGLEVVRSWTKNGSAYVLVQSG